MIDAYLDLLEQIAPTSMVFETQALMPYEVSMSVYRAIMQLNEKLDEIDTDDEFLDSYVARYVISEDGDARGEFVKAGDKRKKKPNREYITVEFQLSNFQSENCFTRMCNKCNPLPLSN